jgi:hypothetical protein
MYSGHPLSSFTREVVDLWNNTVGTMYGEYKVTRYKPAQATGYDALFEAIMSEDEGKMPEIRAILDRQGMDEKKVYDGLRDRAREAYQEGELDFDRALKLLEAEEGKPEGGVYWTVKEWEARKAAGDWSAEFEYSKYGDYHAAIMSGVNLRELTKELIDHYSGDPKKAKSTIASQITEYWKPKYAAASNIERSRMKGYLLNAYALLGYDRYKKSEDINDWLKKDSAQGL